jgi:hypothetical protein
MEKTARGETSQYLGRNKYYLDKQLKEEKMGGACGTHAKDKKCTHSLCRKTMEDKIILRQP